MLTESYRYRPGVHEACLTQLLRVVLRRLVAQNAAHSAPRLAAAFALNPNQYFTFLPYTKHLGQVHLETDDITVHTLRLKTH